MNIASLLRITSLAFAVALCCSDELIAQERRLFAVQVNDLTPGTRDDISRQLERSKEVRIVFACVPAGILVFESIEGSAASGSTRERTMPLLRHRSRSSDISELNLSIAEAEARCAQVRQH